MTTYMISLIRIKNKIQIILNKNNLYKVIMNKLLKNKMPKLIN